MLYLVRKTDQSIIVNNNIEIKVIEINRNTVKLGIDFPPTATVLRKELHEKIKNENLKSSQSDFDMDNEDESLEPSNDL
jgi:carbon storage regulator